MRNIQNTRKKKVLTSADNAVVKRTTLSGETVYYGNVRQTRIFDSLGAKEILCDRIGERKRSIRKADVRVIQTIDDETLATKAIIGLRQGIAGSSMKPLSGIATDIGRLVLNGLEDRDESLKVRNKRRYKIGFELLDAMNAWAIEFHRGPRERDEWTIRVKKDRVVDELFASVDAKPSKEKLYTEVQFEKPDHWEGQYHPIGGEMVRRLDEAATQYFVDAAENCPGVLEVINKHQDLSYTINRRLLEVYNLVKADEPLFTLKRKDFNMVQKESLRREIKSVLRKAGDVGDRPFWEYMFYDNRSRLYSSSVWLNHGGSKLSKSLYQFAEKKAMGENGWMWLLIHTANTWGGDTDLGASSDKLPVFERYQYALTQLKTWLKWAEDPINYKEERVDLETGEVYMERPWAEADDPFCFLAAILEIKAAIDSGNRYTFESGIMVAFDATCSGLQVLASLIRDAFAGSLCNLIPSNVVGDYYNTIAKEVWKKCVYTKEEEESYYEVVEKLTPLRKRINDILEMKKTASRKELLDEAWSNMIEYIDSIPFSMAQKKFEGEQLNQVMDNLLDLQLDVTKAKENDDKEALKEAKKKRSDYNRDLGIGLFELSRVFWAKKEAKKRKLCKRPCMTKWYSAGVETMAESMMDDWSCEKGFGDLNETFSFWLCLEIDKTCDKMLSGPAALMRLFIKIGLESYYDNKKFDMIAPVTGFKFVQSYMSTETTVVDSMSSSDQRIQVRLYAGKGDKPNYKKVLSATSPNIVHLLDSQIVAGIILKADYNVSCIHDSFSTCPADAGALFDDIRDVFVEIFDKDILMELLLSKDCEHLLNDGFEYKKKFWKIEYGDMVIPDIPDNEWCFS